MKDFDQIVSYLADKAIKQDCIEFLAERCNEISISAAALHYWRETHPYPALIHYQIRSAGESHRARLYRFAYIEALGRVK